MPSRRTGTLFLLAALALLSGACVRTVIKAPKAVVDTLERAELLPLAREGDPDAQYRLGETYCCGFGAIYDTREALAWFCRAARAGHREAMDAIGRIYAGKEGFETLEVRRDPAVALMWYGLAWEAGVVTAEKERDALMRQMSEADIARARRLRADWKRAPCEL